MIVKRGEVYFAVLDPVVGSEQGGTRPVVVLQNELGNTFSPTVIAAITTKNKKPEFPTHVPVQADYGCLFKDSVIMLEQIRTIDKCRLLECIGVLDNKTMQEIDRAFLISLGITEIPKRNTNKTTEEHKDDSQKSNRQR